MFFWSDRNLVSRFEFQVRIPVIRWSLNGHSEWQSNPEHKTTIRAVY